MSVVVVLLLVTVVAQGTVAASRRSELERRLVDRGSEVADAAAERDALAVEVERLRSRLASVA